MKFGLPRRFELLRFAHVFGVRCRCVQRAARPATGAALSSPSVPDAHTGTRFSVGAARLETACAGQMNKSSYPPAASPQPLDSLPVPLPVLSARPTRAHHACLTVAPQGRGTRVHRWPHFFLGLNRLGCSRRAWDGPGSPTAMADAVCNVFCAASVCLGVGYVEAPRR